MYRGWGGIVWFFTILTGSPLLRQERHPLEWKGNLWERGRYAVGNGEWRSPPNGYFSGEDTVTTQPNNVSTGDSISTGDSAPNVPVSPETVELAPSYTLPTVVVLLGAALAGWNVWVGGAIALFGIFLLIQAATLRLRFTATDLDICRGRTLIRRFPYAAWQNWEIFWSPAPTLFYFKEIKSIHFVPVLFDPKMLATCLEQRVPRATLAAQKSA